MLGELFARQPSDGDISSAVIPSSHEFDALPQKFREELSQFYRTFQPRLDGIESRMTHITDASVLPRHLKLVSDERADRILGEVVARLSTETTYLHEIGDTKIGEALACGFKGSSFGALVVWMNGDTRPGRLVERLAGGERDDLYNPMFDIALILDKKPQSKDILVHMIDDGTLPEGIAALDKALTHDLQISKSQRALLYGAQSIVGLPVLALRFLGVPPLVGRTVFAAFQRKVSQVLFPGLFNDNALSELHASEASAHSPTASASLSDEVEDIVTRVSERKGTKQSPDALLRAYAQLHALRLLGMNDRELGTIVSRAQYNPETESYPKLDAALVERRHTDGLENDALFIQTMSHMHHARELECWLLQQEARAIAIEVTFADREIPLESPV